MPLFKKHEATVPLTLPVQGATGTTGTHGQTGQPTTTSAYPPTTATQQPYGHPTQPHHPATGPTTHHGAGMDRPYNAPNMTDHVANDAGTTVKAGAGRVEQMVGAAVGSNRLKASGAEREAEAHTNRYKNPDIAEAERMESNARRYRERAGGFGN